MRNLSLLAWIASFGTAMGGCAPSNTSEMGAAMETASGAQATDAETQARTRSAVEKLRSGVTLKSLSEAMAQGRAQEELERKQMLEALERLRAEQAQEPKDLGPQMTTGEGPSITLGQQQPERPMPPNTRICPAARTPAPGASELEFRAALVELGNCMRAAMEPAKVMRGALSYLMMYERSTLERPISAMTQDEEILEILRREFMPVRLLTGFTDDERPLRKKLRNSFSDRDLDEISRINRRIHQRLEQAEAYFFALVDEYAGVFKRYADYGNSRYALLLAVRESAAKGELPIELAVRLSILLDQFGIEVPSDPTVVPAELLRPWAVLAISPDPDAELRPLKDPVENPFHLAVTAMAHLAGPDLLVRRQREGYARLRGGDNPTMPLHPAPHPRAVRVAVMDTGVDFRAYPELAEFLSNREIPGSMGSYDYQDGDRNPYLPAVSGRAGHGSGTAASFLTVLSHLAPQVLEERKVDMGVWKMTTIREQLAAPFQDSASWQNRYASVDALVEQAQLPRGQAPQIVSASMGFGLWPFLLNINKPALMKQAPWLWVMAAGNAGRDARESPLPVCLSDLPESSRPSSRLLCVGAIKRGILRDKIDVDSNFGDLVDLYTYESYIHLCSGDTSCATPAIAGLAAIVQAKYPELEPEKLRSVLLASAELRELEVERTSEALAIRPVEKRQVRFLDPATMLDRVLKTARAYAKRKSGKPL